MVNRGDAVNSNEWRLLPIEKQMAWRVPISVMLNMTLLRSTQPVITVSEYLRLHNMSEDTEESNGHWGQQKYHLHPYIFSNSSRTPSLHVIENQWYDSGVNRVDVIPDDMKERGGWNAEGGDPKKGQTGMWPDTPNTPISTALQSALFDRAKVLEWDRARQVLREQGYTWHQTDEKLVRVLNENGWELLYTYQGA